MVDKVDKIWMDGKLINWEDATVHILTHTLHYGMGAFEGIRCYRRKDGTSAVFRLKEHIDRLMQSIKIMGLKAPYDAKTLLKASLETVEASGLDEAYIRPLVFVGDGAMGLYAPNNPVRVAIIVWRWGAYLGEEAMAKGIRCQVSSFARHHVNASMAKGKITGHYVNSILAKREAKDSGMDEAIMLDTEGYVCEASGENIFIVQNGIVRTPPLGGAILGGITRETVLSLLQDLGIPVEEQRQTRDQVWCADEVFMCGTAAEITPVVEVDRRCIGDGKPGPVAKAVQKRFFQIVRGEIQDHPEWLTPYSVG